MKKILFSILVLSTITFAQEVQTKSSQDLKIFAKENLKKSDSNFEIEYLQSKQKSPALAILYSAVLPGMGELYAGNYSSGKYFTISEASLWLVYFGMDYHAGLKKDNYLAYAKTFGGVDVANKDEDFFANIGNFGSIEDYNDDRSFYRRFNEMYNDPSYNWRWNSDGERRAYRRLWVSSQQTIINMRFATGALILNRLMSIINAVRLVNVYNKNLQSESSYNFFMDYNTDETAIQNISINLIKSF